MLAFDKPVNVFGSHAIASNFFFLLFYMSYQTFIHTKSKFSLSLALADLYLIANLKSVSSYILLLIGVILIFVHLVREYRFFKVVGLPIAAIFSAVYVYNPSSAIRSVFNSKNNGFLGRYSNDGVFADTISYITHNLLPVGLWYSEDFFVTDSGYIVYFLKGSIFMVAAIYIGLFFLMRHNISNRRIANSLFVIFCMFEVGYPMLTFHRMLCILPFVMIYLNNLEKVEVTEKQPVKISSAKKLLSQHGS
ncbi:hypothetical protein [Paenibacillus sp. CF384]|uniref:hypothetical protein n=1 Tax=Paenibacillus sp. CF384 TaxID=1884382 RepID=UPI00115F9F1C|nr:hypothetical protein [Paenibacillus sp. CF384]